MKDERLFNKQLLRVFLIQSNILLDDEELISSPKLPASTRDILVSKDYGEYRDQKVKNYEKIWKNTKQKTSIKA